MKKSEASSIQFGHNLGRLALASMIAIGAAGCGKSASKRIDDIDNGQKNFLRAADLIDEWKGPCAKSDVLNLGAYSVLRFDANAFERELNLFGNDTCEDPTFRISYQGEYTVGSGDGYPEEVYSVNFKFDRVTVTPLSDAGVTLLDKSNFCGQEVWAKDQEVDLTGTSGNLGCILEDLPSVGFDVFKVDGKQLQMGRMGIFPAPGQGEQRPKEVSSDIFIRQ
jgi:hypothetical protein